MTFFVDIYMTPFYLLYSFWWSDNLSPHSTPFCKQLNRNFWKVRFLRFYVVFCYGIQSAHWKIGKSSFAFSTVVCLILLSKIKVCGLVVKCAVYVFWLFHLFPHTEKWVCRGIYSKRSGANYPRKYAVLWFFSWQQNYALNVPWKSNIDVIVTTISLWQEGGVGNLDIILRCALAIM